MALVRIAKASCSFMAQSSAGSRQFLSHTLWQPPNDTGILVSGKFDFWYVFASNDQSVMAAVTSLIQALADVMITFIGQMRPTPSTSPGFVRQDRRVRRDPKLADIGLTRSPFSREAVTGN